MFTPEYFIDSVQNAKKQFVNTFVVDSKIKENIISVIDAQTTFVKTAVISATTMTELFQKNFATAFAK